MALLCGIDVGTTHVKVGFFDERGGCVSSVRRPTPRTLPALVAAVLEALEECAARTGRGPDTIGIAGMAETGVPLDDSGSPLTPLLWWNDPRGTQEAAALRDPAASLNAPHGGAWGGGDVGSGGDVVEVYARTGRWVDAKAPLAKWLWLRAHEPDVPAAMRWWASVPDAVAYALTGVLRTHETLAARTLAYDVVRRDYDEDLLSLAGLRPGHLAPTVRAVEPVGGLTARVSGVAAGVPVVIAGHDHAVGAWASGVRRPGHVADSMGTAEAVLAPAAHPPDPRTGLAMGITADPSLDGTGTVLVGGLPTSGGMLDWLLGLTTAPEDPPARGVVEGGARATADKYAALPALLDGVRLPTGIIAEPYLRGRVAPAPDRGRRVTMSGMGPDHTYGDLLAAAMEGTCLHTRWTVAELAAVTGAEAERLVVFGGQVRIPLWTRVKAALSPVPVDVVRADDAVCAGAALIAGQAGGSLDDVPVLPREPQPHDPGLAAAYRPLYERFLTIARQEHG
ncbi:hypothetical protein E1267_16685 [Nonomuraea longispora]|uniref:Carbohydrate kinase n=1 Tax=Nonomuraea longispora TaxID=1848320 RepID=A0A4R4NGE3_9ACTN|nr:FGGY family carbohydrate kinase [Nonomuraea longispora]TDC06387.1 hypothetical protein E1267_16685 [Nonomuraea longispora]